MNNTWQSLCDFRHADFSLTNFIQKEEEFILNKKLRQEHLKITR